MCVGKNSELTTLISVQTWVPMLIKELANSYNKGAPALSNLQKGQRGEKEKKNICFFKGRWLQVVFSLHFILHGQGLRNMTTLSCKEQTRTFRFYSEKPCAQAKSYHYERRQWNRTVAVDGEMCICLQTFNH